MDTGAGSYGCFRTDDWASFRDVPAPQGLEPLCFFALLRHTRVLGYRTIVMDGSRELVRPTLESGKRVQGDLWHVQKNWFKWSVEAIKTAGGRRRRSRTRPS